MCSFWQDQILSGQIFSAFSATEREEIWGRVLSVDGLVPSFHTLFQDIKFLNACADCFKRLIKLSRKDTVFTALHRIFSHANGGDQQTLIEVGESAFITRSVDGADVFDLAYRQLWLFAMRNYHKLPMREVEEAKKKDILAKPGVKRGNDKLLFGFASLAHRLGFESDEINALRNQSTDREIARDALLNARDPGRYRYDETVLESYISQIVNLFATAIPLPYGPSSPRFVCFDPEAARRRCGYPDQEAQEEDARFLFLLHVHEELDTMDEEITSFLVRRSVYAAFFGDMVSFGIELKDEARQEQARQEQARQEQARQEQARQEQARQEQARQEQARQEQARQEQARQEQARQEQARQEQARQEQARQEQARQEQARQEQARQEQARQEQARQEQARQEQARQEQARQEQARQEQARQEQARQEQARFERARALQRRLKFEREEQSRLVSRSQAQEFPQQPRNRNYQTNAQKDLYHHKPGNTTDEVAPRRESQSSSLPLQVTEQPHYVIFQHSNESGEPLRKKVAMLSPDFHLLNILPTTVRIVDR